jgi:hypothetical protein
VKDFDVMFSLYCGYTLYDTVIMYINGRETFLMWAHHLMGLLGGLYSMVSDIHPSELSTQKRGQFFPSCSCLQNLQVRI